MRPSHRRASEHYDEPINQKDEDPSRDIQSGALVVLDLLLDWIERTQGSNVALLTNEGEVATASLRVNIEPRLENAEKEATDQALALVRVLRSKWA